MQQETSPNFQDMPHKEGNQANTPPKGQPREGSNPQTGSTIQQDSPEQLAGRNKQQEQDKDRGNAAGNP